MANGKSKKNYNNFNIIFVFFPFFFFCTEGTSDIHIVRYFPHFVCVIKIKNGFSESSTLTDYASMLGCNIERKVY